MDTSKEYILMCEKAEEIQETWKPSAGDWIVMPKVFDKNGQHSCTCLSEFIEVTDEGNFEVLAYWRVYMLADENAPNIFLKQQEVFASNWKKHIFELENNLKWIPRQDQLQEMVNMELARKKIDFHDFCLNSYYAMTKEKCLNSFEQLWLAYIMVRKYMKVWNGKNWTKED